jgi:hypothetical protein
MFSIWGNSAKSGKDFTYADRASKLADSKRNHGDQIQATLKWARTLVLRNPSLSAVLSVMD